MSAGRVWVVGSINMDLVAETPRHPAVGETVLAEGLTRYPGGKGANQAVAAARAGAPTSLVGAVGDDPFGMELLSFLSGQRVDVASVRHVSGPTGLALVVVAGGTNSIVVAAGANADLNERDLDALDLRPGDVLLTQLEIDPATVAAAVAHARSAGATSVLNASPAPSTLDLSADIVVVNEVELSTLSGRQIAADAPAEVIATAARTLGAGIASIATLGARGAVAVFPDRVVEVAAPSVEAVDTTGAGDCFAGWLAAGLAAGDDPARAVERACAAASLSVLRPGAGPSMPTRQEVEALS